jgi:3',5'-cyclic AMP phosphodiesterase CpdA
MLRSTQSAVLLVALAALAAGAACGGDGHAGSPVSPTAPGPPPTVAGPQPISPDVTIAAAGDIGVCGRPEVEATARLIDGIAGPVLALGDIAYPDGTARDFAHCYDPSWGRHRARTRPTPGNHEYFTAGAAPYYDYFGANAGPDRRGYYSFRLGGWLVISLNSNVPADDGSAQMAWLRSTLAAEQARCTLVYWHHPVFSSGRHGSSGHMRAAWRVVQDAGADVVLAAHDHLYERFAPQNADGRREAAGIRQFTVGTGGAQPYAMRALAPNSEVIGTDEGVLRMTLKAEGYDWQFLPIEGKSFVDSGSAVCR